MAKSAFSILAASYAGPNRGVLAVASALMPSETDYAARLARISVDEAPRRSIKFEVYRDTRDEWRWSMIAANGRTVGDSGEGYKNRADMMRMINQIRGAAAIPVVERKPLARFTLGAFPHR